jgi:hypothetical protein
VLSPVPVKVTAKVLVVKSERGLIAVSVGGPAAAAHTPTHTNPRLETFLIVNPLFCPEISVINEVSGIHRQMGTSPRRTGFLWAGVEKQRKGWPPMNADERR